MILRTNKLKFHILKRSQYLGCKSEKNQDLEAFVKSFSSSAMIYKHSEIHIFSRLIVMGIILLPYEIMQHF